MIPAYWREIILGLQITKYIPHFFKGGRGFKPNNYAIFAPMARKNNRVVFENVEVVDAGAKGKAVAKAPDGRVIFINNAVPGDVVTVQTFKKKKAFYEASVTSISKYSENLSSIELTTCVVNCFRFERIWAERYKQYDKRNEYLLGTI